MQKKITKHLKASVLTLLLGSFGLLGRPRKKHHLK
jgi:hypothetical protein